MSTRSMIAIKQEDGTIKGMWKHWDGYPSYMCEMLYSFQSRELAEELVKFGDCDSIFSEEYLQTHLDDFDKSKLTHLSNGYYIYYGQGEPRVYANCKDCFYKEDIEYLYVWDDYSGWVVIDYGALELLGC